ncbi:MAG: DUF934 domain-containing protein [Parvularculaceae bacterium]|nr:DUF934 domain-containing protein [Parvularculaceae bacterium]
MPAFDLSGRPRAALDVVSLEAWRAAGSPAGAVILVPSSADMARIGAELSRARGVVLEFPSFRDGRAYTQARLLRERFGFRGEIRAIGEVLRDQILFMARAGFDAFEAPAEQLEGFLEALVEFGDFYQSAADDAAPIARRRSLRSAAA